MRARKEMAGRKRNRTMCVLLSVLMLLLSACHGAEEGSGQSGKAEVEATIYADFSGGSETAQEDGLIRSMTMTVTEVTGQTLAECLSQWTGLDFTLNSAVVDGTAAGGQEQHGGQEQCQKSFSCFHSHFLPLRQRCVPLSS